MYLYSYKGFIANMSTLFDLLTYNFSSPTTNQKVGGFVAMTKWFRILTGDTFIVNMNKDIFPTSYQ